MTVKISVRQSALRESIGFGEDWGIWIKTGGEDET
jgi:hypothetical protein